MSAQVLRYSLGGFGVELLARDDATARYFDGFYQPAGDDATERSVEVELEPDPAPRAGWTIDVDGDAVHVAARGPGAYAVWSPGSPRYAAWTATRRLVRDLWLARMRRRGPVAFVHASAVDDGARLVLFVGDRRAGKTSLMLDAALRHGWRLISNDCLIVQPTADGPTACGQPTYVGIRADVVGRFREHLMARVAEDPPNRASFERWAREPATPGREHKLYLSHGAFCRAVHPTLRLADRQVIVTAIGFAGDDAPVAVTSRTDDLTAFLRANPKRTGYVTPVVGPAEALPNSPAPLVGLARGARFLDYRHRGEFGPLTDELDATVHRVLSGA